jgi:hypothetical protein
MTSMTLLLIGLAYLSVVAILFVCIAYYCDRAAAITRTRRRLRDADGLDKSGPLHGARTRWTKFAPRNS